ncbi:HNH endonuclease [Brevibacillus sp. AG]|uniref:HNH endonuclease n=1 Tax=Brevibacillus sp. AG TaxID=3020891 RepID=UPI00232B8403|nr:HNH endonuclease [Brevibacillus sp. AG]MDC0764873.1 HNH endonuclease [Brevibacillus sp. AG]
MNYDDNRWKYSHDHRLLFELHFEYRVTVTSLANFLGLEYNAAYSAAMRAYDHTNKEYKWVRESISDEDRDVLLKMISNRIYRFAIPDKKSYWLIPPPSYKREMGFALLVRESHRTVYAYLPLPLNFETQLFNLLEESEQNGKGELLVKIHKISNVLTTTTLEKIERIQRSKALVIHLKRLYMDTCQLCNPEFPIPRIITEDGYYTELHHIVPISTVKHASYNEEEHGELDTAQNAIIVCPHHHKVLHYFEGGCDQLHRDLEGNLFFITKNDTRFPVYLNYHLE